MVARKLQQNTMPKQRKTLQQLAESGTLHKNPGRYVGRWVAQTAPFRPIGKAPAHLPATEKAIWAELTKAAQPGLLQRSDRLFLEVCCKLVARIRTAENPKSSEINSLTNILGKLGLNPTDRAKLDLETSTQPKTNPSPWDALDELD
jgi:phage terminase small subunit